MTDESAVKVCVRVRPVITREESQSPEPVHLYWRATKHAIQQVDEGSSKSFGFDRVFSASETTGQLYEDIARPLVVSAVEGYNGTIFAYGQTSSGKTFTMMGGDHNPGVIPLAMADVFKTIKNFPQKEFLLRVSYMEIYNETVTDLLCDRWKRKPLEIREGNYKNVYVADLTEELVTSPEQALSWINKGEKNRHYGKTKMNERSSRSHTIFRMILESRDKCDPASAEYADGAIIVSHLNLVDLAGTERASQTGAEGARLKEGCNINRSLFTLGQVIKKLSDETQKGFLNYRDSKLTRILQNSLGGNAKAVIICTVTAVALEETLSTLQFASAAKCMKNDPHVTEVSDEGALLKRYRTEIVDLRRRLQEVSSVTQTTATERESLCQLLQEKDQLQREQEDRIKNLTKLLVTSSNVTLVPKVPKRRMTWGGQLLRSAHLLNEDAGLSNWSFAEPNVKKRMANLTLVTEQGDDEDEFDSQFDFTSLEEPQMDMEMSAITVRNSSEGGLDSTQMYQEIQKRQKVEQLNSELELKVSNLQKMLDSQAEMSEEKEANQLQLSELRDHLMELQQKLDFEVQQRQKTEEEKSLLELKVTDLEKSSQNECAKLRRELEEAIQLCENVYFDKDAVSTERDLIRHSLESMTTDIETLRTENASLQKDNDDLRCDLEERREAAEFEKLEQESKIGYEKELEAEIFRLQKSAKESKDVIQKLQTDLTIMSVELQKKADITSELQSFPEKNLMDEVKQLRRSLDDAELLSLETKREWAFLRTENISLKEKDAEMTKNYEKMECEVKVLQTMLDEKKSCFKQMQGDLQKELTCAFKENTRLTALLDGKVPKDLTDNLVLEKTVGKLQQELYQCHEREHDLQQRLEEMNTRFVQVNQTQTVVCDLSEEPCSVPEEPNAQSILTDNFHILAEGKSISEEHATSIEKDAPSDEYRNKTEESNSELTSEPKSKVPAQTEALLTLISEERDQLQKMLQDLTEERDQLKMDIEENIEMMIESQTELRDYQAKVKDLQGRIKSLEGESKCSDQTKEQDVHLEKLQEKINKITVELRLAVAEKDRLLAELHKFEQTKSDFVYLTEENNRNQESVKQLEVDNCHMKTHLDEKSEMILNLSTQLSSVQEERDALSSALSSLKSDRKEETSEALDQLLKMEAVSNNLRLKDAELTRQVTDMSQQIHDHQADVQLLRQEKDMLLAALEEANLKTEEVISRLASLHAERDMLLCENTRASQQATDVIENQKQVIGTLHDERDLLRSDLHVLSKERDHLKNELEMQMQQGPAQSSRCVANTEELLQEILNLSTQLSSVQEERDALSSALSSLKSDREEETSLARDQLLKMEAVSNDLRLKDAELTRQVTDMSQQIHDHQADVQLLRQEKDMLLAALEEANLKTEEVISRLASLHAERDMLLCENTRASQQATDVIENLKQVIGTLHDERNLLQSDLHVLSKERDHLKNELDMQMQQGPAQSSSCVANTEELLQEIQQLKEELNAVTEQKNRLQTDLQYNLQLIEKLHKEFTAISAERDCLTAKRDSACNISNVPSLLDGGDLQEILNGVRKLVNLHGEGKREAPLHSQSSTESQKDLDKIQALCKELESLKNESVTLRKDLQEAAKTSRTYQELLHITKEELRQQQKESTEMMSCSTERESKLQSQLKHMNEELLALTSAKDQLDAETLNMQSNLTSLTKEKNELQILLEGTRQKNDQLRHDLQTSEETRIPLTEKLGSLTNQLEREKTNKEQVLESLQDITKERDQLKQDLALKIQDLAQFKSNSEQLANQNILLEAEVHSLNQSFQHSSHTSNLISQIQASIEKIQETFVKLQLISSSQHKTLSELNREENTLTYQLLRSVPIPERKVIVKLVNETTLLNDVLASVVVLYRRLAHHCKAHFERKLQQDVASFEKSQLQDLLDHMTQAPLSLSSQQYDYQQTCDLRLSHLLHGNQLSLQKLECILVFLEGGLAKHAISVSKVHQHCICAIQQFRNVLESSNPDAVVQMFKRIVLHRAELREDLNQFYIPLIDACNSELRLLQSSADPDQRLPTLLQNSSSSKTKAELPQENLRQSPQLQTREQTEVNMKQRETIAQSTEETTVRSCDASSQSEGVVTIGQTAEDFEAAKDKLVKMELELIAVKTSHKNEVAQLHTVLEHRAELIRKLKESLRENQQDHEQSYIDVVAEKHDSAEVKEKRVEELHRKTIQLERHVSNQQAEIDKWKRRAYKLKETKKVTFHTPVKHQAPLTKTESNSTKTYLDSPKSKFFDVSASVPVSFNHPAQFFDNSTLGSAPDSGSKMVRLPTKPDATGKATEWANECPTQ